MSRSPKIPSYRRHSSGQARVTINGKDILLGKFGSEASKEAYRRVLAESLASPSLPTSGAKKSHERTPVSAAELIVAYWKFAVKYYGLDKKRGDFYCLRAALKVVRSLYGRTLAQEFGPLALKACRQQMVQNGWSRRYINAQIDRIRRMFRWAGEEEILPGAVYQNLRTVSSLRFGRGEARETSRVLPVPQAHIDAALRFMPPTVAAMVQSQLLLGCRPEEICLMRPKDVDHSDPTCWIYRPGSDEGQNGNHKTAHHGHDRLILIGPKAQKLLDPFMDGPVEAFCFSPRDSEMRRNTARRENRRSPMTPSQRARKPKPNPRRQPSDRYDTHSYRRAITRACRKADQAAHEKDASISLKTVIVPAWSPNRLRHNRATELRRHGLDVAKTVLGHSKVETTLIYAERDIDNAKKLVATIG